MVHALKPNPKSHIQEGWRIADFFSHHPEAMHMVGRCFDTSVCMEMHSYSVQDCDMRRAAWCLQFTFLMDDVGVPANYREMPGFGVHTYTLISREGKVTYVKFHWVPKAGDLCVLRNPTAGPRHPAKILLSKQTLLLTARQWQAHLPHWRGIDPLAMDCRGAQPPG